MRWNCKLLPFSCDIGPVHFPPVLMFAPRGHWTFSVARVCKGGCFVAATVSRILLSPFPTALRYSCFVRISSAKNNVTHDFTLPTYLSTVYASTLFCAFPQRGGCFSLRSSCNVQTMYCMAATVSRKTLLCLCVCVFFVVAGREPSRGENCGSEETRHLPRHHRHRLWLVSGERTSNTGGILLRIEHARQCMISQDTNTLGQI